MSDKVIEFPGQGSVPLGKAPRLRTVAPRAVADGLLEQVDTLDQIIVLGVTADGALYAASTHPDIADNLLLLERMRRKLLASFGDDEFV